jgi:CubicO group peptidase (beta-lactamase class C family)
MRLYRPGAAPARVRAGALALLAALLLVAWSSPAWGQRVAPGSRAVSAQVDRLFAQWDRSDSPGAAVLVVRDGEVLHARGYGMANLEHGVGITPSTVFDIASVAKQFAAFAILVLAEEGAIDLEDDVRAHIPELPDFGEPLRIRHLLHHTAGLRDWPGVLRMGGWDFADVLSHEQILAMVRNQRRLNFPPGSEFAYSNTGYNLLAEIVARATGMPFAEWTHRHLFEPLAMASTHFHDDHTRLVPSRADAYARDARGGFRRVPSNLTALGSSSLFTTLEDLAKWIAHLDAPPAGREDVVARMHTPGALDSGESIPYGYGLETGEYRGVRTVSHTGSWANYVSSLLRVPDRAFTVAILANTGEVDVWTMSHWIAELYLRDALAPAARRAPPSAAAPSSAPAAPAPAFAPTAEDLSQYGGQFYSPELFTSYWLHVYNGVLVAEHFRLGVIPFRPVALDRFAADGFGRVEFLRDPDGTVRGFEASSARNRGILFERVGPPPE